MIGSRQSRFPADSGAALVELVFALPMLLVLLVGSADFARVFYTAIEVTNAARTGAQYGGKDIGSSSVPADMQAAATSAVNISGVSATASRTCQCATPSGTFPDTVSCATDPAVACPSPKFRVITVTVTASAPFNTISPYIPAIPRPLTITRTAVMRVSE